MVEWHPISKDALLQRIAQGVARMSPAELRLWKAIRIEPSKWSQDPYGRDGQGFWAVAVIGSSVIWFNDIEDGFNRSRYNTFGEVQEYWCNQDELDTAIKYLMSAMEHDADLVGMSKPQFRWNNK